jgi:hypothetical protein
MVWGALLGAGISAFAGAAADKSAMKANKANIAGIGGLYDKQYGSAWGSLLKANQATEQGYEAAKYAASVAGHQSQVDILNTGTQAGAAVQADLTGKGLGNTTLVGNAANQVASMTQANLAKHGEQTAMINAGIETNYAAAKASGYGALANLATWKADGLGGIMGNTQHKSGGGGMWNMAGSILGGIDWGKADWGKW